MTPTTRMAGGSAARRWRIARWGAAVFLLALPWLAMQFDPGVHWSPLDFVTFGAMLLVACSLWELAARMSGNRAYRIAAGIALATAFMLVWVNLAVGLIGSENNPANLMYGGVLIVGIIGAFIARLQPAGMARALLAMVFAQAVVAVIVLFIGEGEIVLLTALFVVPWLISAWLFRRAAREQRSPPVRLATG